MYLLYMMYSISRSGWNRQGQPQYLIGASGIGKTHLLIVPVPTRPRTTE
jgi:chromosomal replication initiation ATPase DnaA